MMQAVSPRARIVEGLAAALKRKGYAATTIADIVRHAKVSKRTFYEHFRDKEACFLAAYAAAADRAIEAIVGAAAAAADLPWEEQLRAASRAYVQALESEAALTRVFLLEIHAAGRRGLQMRREVHRKFAELLTALVERTRAEHPEVRSLTPGLAMALVGGINEVLLLHVEEGRTDQLGELDRTASELVRAVLLAPPQAPARPDRLQRRGPAARK